MNTSALIMMIFSMVLLGWSGTGCHASGKNPEEPED